MPSNLIRERPLISGVRCSRRTRAACCSRAVSVRSYSAHCTSGWLGRVSSKMANSSEKKRVRWCYFAAAANRTIELSEGQSPANYRNWPPV